MYRLGASQSVLAPYLCEITSQKFVHPNQIDKPQHM